MPSDAAKTREAILASAQAEFLRHGFSGASLRKIAAGAGVTTGALYRHFADKATLFEALVAPCFTEFMQVFDSAGKGFLDNPDENSMNSLWPASEGNLVMLTTYMYDHLDVFRLLLSASEQTAYESFTHDLINREVDMTIDYLAALKQKGVPVSTISRQELHMYVSAQFSVFFEMILHDVPRAEALAYTKRIFHFFAAGWKEIFTEH